jgi:hypothetical protein
MEELAPIPANPPVINPSHTVTVDLRLTPIAEPISSGMGNRPPIGPMSGGRTIGEIVDSMERSLQIDTSDNMGNSDLATRQEINTARRGFNSLI